MELLHGHLTVSSLFCITLFFATHGAAIQLGDMLVFKNRRAFERRNFAEAALLRDTKATDLMWHPTRPRHGYLSSTRTEQALLISSNNGAEASFRATAPAPTHLHAAAPLSAPPPTAGADVPPFQAHGRARSSPPGGAPESAPASVRPPRQDGGAAAPPMASAAAPDAGEGMPFIGSNPAVPLPTGMADTATVLPVPDRGDDKKKVASLASFSGVQTALIGSLVVFSIGFLFQSYYSLD